MDLDVGHMGDELKPGQSGQKEEPSSSDRVFDAVGRLAAKGGSATRKVLDQSRVLARSSRKAANRAAVSGKAKVDEGIRTVTLREYRDEVEGMLEQSPEFWSIRMRKSVGCGPSLTI